MILPLYQKSDICQAFGGGQCDNPCDREEFYKDWNENGSLTESATTATGKYNAGYKFPRPTSGYEINGGATPSSPINPTIGKYDNGADAITGEQKIFAVLERDWWSDKWKIVRFEYVN